MKKFNVADFTAQQKDQLFPYRAPEVLLLALYYLLACAVLVGGTTLVFFRALPPLTLRDVGVVFVAALGLAVIYIFMKRFAILRALAEIPGETLALGYEVGIAPTHRSSGRTLYHSQLFHLHEVQEGAHKGQIVKFLPVGADDYRGYVIRVSYFSTSNYLLFLPKTWLV